MAGIKRLLVSALVFCTGIVLPISAATYNTLPTARGEWMDPAIWDGASPGTYTLTGPGSGHTYNIYGRIEAGTKAISQSLTVDKGLLNIMDTLIIYGNLIIGNNGDLYLANGSVLIVYGNVTVDNQVTISANSYFVIMGDFTKTGSSTQGSFTSDDQPSNVFIGGTVVVPTGWADDGPTDVFNCSLPDVHDNSDCNYGDPIDLQDSPISDFVNGNCTDIPVISFISSNSPVAVGSTINLNATADPGTGTWPMTYYWDGPLGFTSVSEDTTRASATTDMTGYYELTVFNAEGCATSDSVYVEVTASSCCSGFSYISRDNYTGNWEDVASWATPDEPWRPLPPPTNPMNTQTLCINGTITLNGNLTINGGNQKICDTLIITGNLSVQSYGLTVAPDGVLIILGDYTGISGSMDVDGRVVVVGDINSPASNSVYNDGAFYVFDDTPVIDGFIPTGDENTLQINDPTLYNLVTELICEGSGLSGGTIAADQQVCEGDDAVLFSNVADAGPGTISYQWYYSTDSSDPLTGTWSAIAGATGNQYDPGILPVTTYYVRRATDSYGCSSNSNILTITIYRVPETGPVYYLPAE